MALPAPVALLYPPDHDHEEEAPGPPPPIFAQLPETDIGEFYRGDTVVLPIWYARNYYDAEDMGGLLDLSGATVWFTAKVDLSEQDTDPFVIQRTTANGGVQILDPPTAGAFRVWLDPASTWALDDDTTYLWDVQVSTADAIPVIVNVYRGVMKVLRDVTRATSS